MQRLSGNKIANLGIILVLVITPFIKLETLTAFDNILAALFGFIMVNLPITIKRHIQKKKLLKAIRNTLSDDTMKNEHQQ
ncbi:hypothetical protein AALH30_22665 [Blautia pseudococcoides]|uniref:hypothetical protein n=1 Tax=Blautia pseudococcoides TaxID=1796616 RepID=UPI003514823A